MYSNFIFEKTKLLAIKDNSIAEMEDNFMETRFTEMNPFIIQVFPGPIYKDNWLDKRYKQLFNNVSALIKILDMNKTKEEKINKIKDWIISARNCDIKAALFSNRILRERFDELSKTCKEIATIDDEIVTAYFDHHKFHPYNGKIYDEFLLLLEKGDDLTEIMYITRYVECQLCSLLQINIPRRKKYTRPQFKSFNLTDGELQNIADRINQVPL